MKLSLLPLAAVLVLAGPAWCDDAKSGVDGAWVPVMAEYGGLKYSDDQLKTIKLVLAKGKYKATVGAQIDEGVVKSDTSLKPMTMDITSEEGPNKGKTFMAIYELSGDTLRICYDLSGKVRPTEFKSKKDSRLFLVTYKRVKK